MQLTEQDIVDKLGQMPAFPSVVISLLAALDDESATLGTLVHYVERDPVITGKVMAQANSVVMRTHPGQQVNDVITATSMIGVARIREIVLAVSLVKFAQDSHATPNYWVHSVATGIAAQELARGCGVSSELAFVTGLLHDIGQLWLNNFYPLEFARVRRTVIDEAVPVLEAERQVFALDHCQIGVIMTRYWNLPENIINAISVHHQPDAYAENKLVALTHVAEILANALDLGRREENQVAYLSAAACEHIGVDWNEAQIPYLFGKIEARTQHAAQIFR